VFLCLLTAAPLHADNDLTLFGAVQRQDKLTVETAGTAASTTSNFDPGRFGTFGLRVGHGRIFGGEHTIAYSRNFLDSKTKALFYNSGFLVQAPLPKVKPYGTAGLGTILTWGTDDLNRPSFGKIGNRLALNYGGGVKVLPAGPVGIRFDIRGYWIPNARFNVPLPTASDPLATVKSQSQNLNVLEAGFGIIFAWKGAR
jgi:opacity protein-like surface antigen